MSYPAIKTVSVLSLALFVLTVSLQTQNVHTANILGLFISHSPSHLIIHMSVAKALAEAGHNVTVVSAYKPSSTHNNIRHIIIPPLEEHQIYLKAQMHQMISKKHTLMDILWALFGSMSVLIDMQFDIAKDQRFTMLHQMPDTKFDLVILGYCFNDFLLSIAAKFNCPVILNWIGPSLEMVNVFVGNPRETAYVANINIGVKAGKAMTFPQRIQNVLTSLSFQLINKMLEYRMDNLYRQLFPTESLPSHQEMRKNVSLLFCNQHFTEDSVRPNVPALIEIGGIQIKESPDTLPEEISAFLDGVNEYGAIFFSLGTNLQSSNIEPKIVEIIFRTLASLKQNVIWKWENLDETPGKSQNILYKKWLPQDDILAHPNLKLFITHTGRGSITEAQFHGVPMVALPVFADQHDNAEKMVADGYGLKLDILQLDEHSFNNTIIEVLTNPIYMQKVKKFSHLYRDRPLTPRESVVYWTEYVIRHHGAVHMQSPLVHMNVFQSSNLDVIALLCIVVYLGLKILQLIFRLVWVNTASPSKTSGIGITKIKNKIKAQ